MKRHTLVDLCCPAAAGSLDEVAAAARAAGLDALVYVVDSADELPDEEEVAAAGSDGLAVHPAVAALGPGYRFALLLEDWAATATYAAVEALGDPAAIQAAVAEVGGCALPVSPRQSPDGDVVREAPRLAAGAEVGTVALVARGTRLGRDLDMEDASAEGRRVLAGSGPFAEAEDVGRFATLMPVPAGDAEALVTALRKGLGVAVEIEALAREERAGRPRKKRRRRRRGRDGDGGGGGGD